MVKTASWTIKFPTFFSPYWEHLQGSRAQWYYVPSRCLQYAERNISNFNPTIFHRKINQFLTRQSVWTYAHETDKTTYETVDKPFDPSGYSRMWGYDCTFIIAQSSSSSSQFTWANFTSFKSELICPQVQIIITK